MKIIYHFVLISAIGSYVSSSAALRTPHSPPLPPHETFSIHACLATVRLYPMHMHATYEVRLKKYTYANFFISSTSTALTTFSSLYSTHSVVPSSGISFRMNAT
jgi:hypothetical protein